MICDLIVGDDDGSEGGVCVPLQEQAGEGEEEQGVEEASMAGAAFKHKVLQLVRRSQGVEEERGEHLLR